MSRMASAIMKSSRLSGMPGAYTSPHTTCSSSTAFLIGIARTSAPVLVHTWPRSVPQIQPVVQPPVQLIAGFRYKIWPAGIQSALVAKSDGRYQARHPSAAGQREQPVVTHSRPRRESQLKPAFGVGRGYQVHFYLGQPGFRNGETRSLPSMASEAPFLLLWPSVPHRLLWLPSAT